VTARNDERKVKAAAANKHADKIGYVPRNQQASSMQASGLTSAGMMGKGRNDADQVRLLVLSVVFVRFVYSVPTVHFPIGCAYAQKLAYNFVL
jgi:hypothetical protein